MRVYINRSSLNFKHVITQQQINFEIIHNVNFCYAHGAWVTEQVAEQVAEQTEQTETNS